MAAKSLRYAGFALLAIALAAGPAAAAQNPAPARPQRGAVPAPPGRGSAPVAGILDPIDDDSARETRQRFSNLIRQYPPSLGEVLRLDPSLMTSESYLTPYPGLAAFLAQHPEVAHNPAYFVGEMRFANESSATSQKIRLVENALAVLALLTGFITLVSILGWLLKSVIDYRRWLRVSKVQTEVHMKLLDRFTSNEEILAYIQTPVGRRFLESAPMPIDVGPRAISAPIGRILWSVQAGLVVGLAGIGLLYVSAHLAATTGDFADIAQVPFVVGMLGLAIGIGFVLSAVVAYALSHRLGLFEAPTVTPHA